MSLIILRSIRKILITWILISRVLRCLIGCLVSWLISILFYGVFWRIMTYSYIVSLASLDNSSISIPRFSRSLFEIFSISMVFLVNYSIIFLVKSVQLFPQLPVFFIPNSRFLYMSVNFCHIWSQLDLLQSHHERLIFRLKTRNSLHVFTLLSL